MNNTERKLRKNEVVHAETFELACKVCELADKLGLKWNDKRSYLDNIEWSVYKSETCYNINGSGYADKEFFVSEGYDIISAVEWLNRHGVFCYGQKVWVSVFSEEKARERKQSRIYISPKMCVTKGKNHNFKNNETYDIVKWDFIVSPFPEWKDKNTNVKIIFGEDEWTVTAEEARDIAAWLRHG